MKVQLGNMDKRLGHIMGFADAFGGWKVQEIVEKPTGNPGMRIHCYSCRKEVSTKSAVKMFHRGHSVGYVEVEKNA